MPTAHIASDSAREIASARTAHEKAIQNRTSIEARLKARRDSIAPLTRSISEAIASGDDARASALRAERAAAQSETPDLERAITLATEAANSTDRDLARLELPALRAEFEAEVLRFVTLAEEANQASSAILAAQGRYHRRFSCAELAANPVGDEGHAKNIMGRTMTPLARIVFDKLRDYR